MMGAPYSTKDDPVPFNSPYTFNHDYLTFNGRLQQPATSKPFHIEESDSAYLSNDALAADLGYPEDSDAVRALREGVPHWRLEVLVPTVARYFNIPAETLRARLSAAKNKIWGRKITDIPPATAYGGFAGLIMPTGDYTPL